MLDLYYTVRSVTPGQKGRDALTRAGLRCRLFRAPSATSERGCAYALALRQADGVRAAAVLERAGVRVEGRWLRRPDGSFERVGP